MTKNLKIFRWLFFCSLLSESSHCTMVKEKNLLVGEELLMEKLPLQNGAYLYHLQGLKPQTWYEVKISYPASIPSSFSLQLKRDASDLWLNQGRKLLNTEKLIFKTDGLLPLADQDQDQDQDQSGFSVLVNVEPEGIVAIPGKQGREDVIFNIVCDELLLGIPHQAWFVVVLAVVCLVLGFVVPSFLPLILLPKNEKQLFSHHTVAKDS